MSLRYENPDALVQTDWLERHLGDADLRIFDCTTFLLPAEPGDSAPYRIRAGRQEYEAGHIPGAGFIDIQNEISDQATDLKFMLPPAEQFAAAISRHGVGDGTRVVLYSADSIMWATRVWWMLRAFGFDAVAVLDGGWEKWRAEGRPISAEPSGYPPASFFPRPRPGLFIAKEQVLAALGNEATVIVNALPPEYHKGLQPSRYGRPGRVPGSVNVPAASLVDPKTRAFVSPADASDAFEARGIEKSKNVICYCGGGISATVDLFLLHQLGYQQISLYDASLGEWARDNSLPIETD